MDTKINYSLVTGSSGGIGKSIAKELASRGNNILLVARSTKELEKVATEILLKYNVQVHYLSIDLSLPDSPTELLKWISDNQFNVTILVNNAGYGLWGDFQKLSLKEQLNMMQLNMTTIVSLTHLMIPLLKKQPQAYILNISSIAAFCAVANFSVYGATKSFVLMFSQGLRSELGKSNISLTCVNPGAVITKFVQRAGMLERHEKMTRRFGMEPDAIAHIAVAAMYKKRKEVVPGLSNKFMVFAMKILPNRLVAYIASFIYS